MRRSKMRGGKSIAEENLGKLIFQSMKGGRNEKLQSVPASKLEGAECSPPGPRCSSLPPRRSA